MIEELDSKHLIVVSENCRPILGEETRYRPDESFMTWLLPPPQTPRLDVERHMASMQRLRDAGPVKWAAGKSGTFEAQVQVLRRVSRPWDRSSRAMSDGAPSNDRHQDDGDKVRRPS